jgi:UDP-N-acetylglucosamine/UDP-N-acetylgalactosamine 4-epimerase
VQANLCAALVDDASAVGQVYNVAAGQRTTLLALHELLAAALRERRAGLTVAAPTFAKFREGDVRHSLADISKARALLGYEPTHDVRAGLREAVGWYSDHLVS